MNELLKILLTISLTASAMILVVMGVRAMLAKRMNPVVIAALWAVVLLRLCVPITLESPVHVGDLIPEAPAVTEQNVEAEVQTVNVPQTNTMVNHADIPAPVDDNMTPQTEVIAQPKEVDMTQPTVWQRMVEISNSISLWSVLAAVWILGAVIVLGNTLRQGMKFKCRLRKCKRVMNGEIMHVVNQQRQDLGIRQQVRVIVCDEIWAPAVFGCFRPMIILPRAFAQGMDKQTMRCILLHEMCHIKRKDILKSYAWLIAKALHWFNPLVWLAFRKAKDDIELCCDQMVIRHLDDNSKFEYTQSLVDVFRISKQSAAYPVTVSLFENKAKLIERVMRMLKPTKRSKTALAVTILLTLLMVMTCFTTACQPVATAEDAVMAEQESSEQVQQEQTSVPEAAEDIPEVKEPVYDAPKHWTQSITQDGSVVEIDVDADIVIPNVEAIPTWDVQANVPFTQEMVDKMIQLFFKDAPLYKPYTTYGTQLQLDTALDDYDRMQKGTFKFPSYCDEKSKQEIIENTKKYIDRVQSELKNPPKEPKLVSVKPELTEDENGIMSLHCAADLRQDEIATFSVGNVSTNVSMSFVDGTYYALRYHEGEALAAPVGDLSISKADAKKQADEILNTLGIEGFALSNTYISGKVQPYISNLDNGKNYAHTFIYTKNAGGIPVCPSLVSGLSPNENQVIKHLNYRPELITIKINDEGLREFSWCNRFEIGNKADSNVALMPFDQIKTRIGEEMCNTYNGMGDVVEAQGWEVEKYLLAVNKISLGYARLPVNGEYEHQQLVPVWTVYATMEWQYVKTENGTQTKAAGKDPSSQVVLTINAIDGSVI